VQIGCSGKTSVQGLEGEERFRLIGVNANANDLEWCQGSRNCSVQDLMGNLTSTSCRLTKINGNTLDPARWPPRQIGFYPGADTEEEKNLSACAFRMPSAEKDQFGDICATTFPEKDCKAYSDTCRDTLEQVWNRTVKSAHEHMQYLVHNITEPYAQIAGLLYDLATNASVFNGTDNFTGRARLERIWPMPLGSENPL
jgi:hypothetical protein